MENKTNPTPMAGFFIRIYWMLYGNIITIFIALYILLKNPESSTLLSIFYFLNIACLVFLRYVDIRYLNGMTTECEPATMSHWKKYSIILIISSIILMLTVQLLKKIVTL